MRRASLLLFLGLVAATALAGCTKPEEGNDGLWGVKTRIDYGDRKALIEMETPWYTVQEKHFSDGDRIGMTCEPFESNWWFKVTAKTTDGRLIGTGNWTNMECKGGYNLFIRSDGSMDLTLEVGERRYHSEPSPVPSRP